MTDSVPVVIAYLRGQLDACHEAIAAIWNASQDQTQTELQKAATLDQAIYLATTLLPDDMRPKGIEVGIPTSPAVDFEDLLG